MKNRFWQGKASFVHTREKVLSAYYSIYLNKKNIFGNNNVVQFQLYRVRPFIKNVNFNIIGDDNIILISSVVNIASTVINIRGFGSELIIHEDCCLRDSQLWIEDSQCKLCIGKNTEMVGAYVGVSEPKSSITIGEDCLLSPYVNVRNGDSHSILDVNIQKRINYAKDVKIGNHVWIASRAWILKGVNVGNNSVIASSSIITKDVPENSMVAGIPGQVKRTNITWVREKILRQSKSIE